MSIKIENLCFKYNDNQEDYFIDNRHDQSILSVIRKMYNKNVVTIPDETWFYKFHSKIGLKYPFWATRRK